MKKNYTNPVVEICTFDIEDVVLAASQVSLGKGSASYNDATVANFKSAVQASDAGAVFVQW